MTGEILTGHDYFPIPNPAGKRRRADDFEFAV